MSASAGPEVDPPQDRIEPPPAFLAWPAPAAVLAALPGARAVGGCVRDALAGRSVHDVDIGAPLPPEEVARRLREAGLKVFETGLAHGTVTAVLDRTPVEVTSLRRDLATDGRHATVAWTTNWREDAARRDFTINAMSLSADGRLWDYHGGRRDLAAGVVRFVGDPATRLSEDYLRALRFFRFHARYGRGEPDREAIAAIRAAVPGLAQRLSAERIWMELKRLLEAPDPTGTLALMAETGVLGAALPEADLAPASDPAAHAAPARGLEAARRLAAIGAPADPLLRVAALLPPGVDAAAMRTATALRLSGEERDTLRHLAAMEGSVPPGGAGEAAFRRFLGMREGARRPDVEREVWLAEARDGGDRAALRAFMRDSAAWPSFPLQGRDALAAGVAPGPGVGKLLAALRAWWIEGGCAADREACLAELRRRIADAPPPGNAGGTR